MTANELTTALLIEIPERFEGARVWRNNRIDAMAVGSGGKLRRVSAGINGQGDITGILPIMVGFTKMGIRLEVEVKAGKDRVSESQLGFQGMIIDAGGIYIVARSVEQCIEELGRAILA